MGQGGARGWQDSWELVRSQKRKERGEEAITELRVDRDRAGHAARNTKEQERRDLSGNIQAGEACRLYREGGENGGGLQGAADVPSRRRQTNGPGKKVTSFLDVRPRGREVSGKEEADGLFQELREPQVGG